MRRTVCISLTRYRGMYKFANAALLSLTTAQTVANLNCLAFLYCRFQMSVPATPRTRVEAPVSSLSGLTPVARAVPLKTPLRMKILLFGFFTVKTKICQLSQLNTSNVIFWAGPNSKRHSTPGSAVSLDENDDDAEKQHSRKQKSEMQARRSFGNELVLNASPAHSVSSGSPSPKAEKTKAKAPAKARAAPEAKGKATAPKGKGKGKKKGRKSRDSDEDSDGEFSDYASDDDVDDAADDDGEMEEKEEKSSRSRGPRSSSSNGKDEKDKEKPEKSDKEKGKAAEKGKEAKRVALGPVRANSQSQGIHTKPHRHSLTHTHIHTHAAGVPVGALARPASVMLVPEKDREHKEHKDREKEREKERKDAAMTLDELMGRCLYVNQLCDQNKITQKNTW